MNIYKIGTELKDDEYLLKIKEGRTVPQGFLTKLTKDGRIPVRFRQWSTYYPDTQIPLPIYVVQESFRTGWRIYGCRFGESQNWAVLLHPDNYTVEIHMDEFISLLNSITVKDGELMGEFKWSPTKLLQKL